MDENKNLNDITDNTEDTSSVEEVNASDIPEETAEVPAEPEDKKVKKEKKKSLIKRLKATRGKKLRNQALFKRGGFALAITAAVLAGLIVFNVLVVALSNRFNLKFDMSPDRINSVSEENLDYIKAVDSPVTVTVCADEDQYVNGGMAYYAQNYYNTTGDNAADYYKQTIKLINSYADYNDKITVKYVDTQDTAFTEITSKYSNEKLTYGDIIISATVKSADGTESDRYKVVTFNDIYTTSSDDTYAAYGYSSNTLSGNNIETALTSAIVYATSTVSKKVALLTGHSSSDYTASLNKLLTENNYEIETISDSMINSVSSDYDAVIIVAPNTDFLGSELDAISEFLDNDGKLSKGLIFFADASAPYLPNLYDFLEQWGISVGEGILFETNASYHIADDPTTMGVFPAEDGITDGMNYCISGFNVPITAAFETEGSITVTPLMITSDTVVAAPTGTSADWTGADSYTKQSYPEVIQSATSEYNDDNEKITSFVMAFGSVEYIYSDWIEQSSLSNKNISLAVAERAVGADDTGISFVSKTITNESFSDKVTQSGTTTVRVLFMILIPILTIAAGIYIFIRRKSA